MIYWLYLLLVIPALIIETLEVLLSPIFYPLAYVLRKKVRKGYKNNWMYYFLWFFLDDSVFLKYRKEYGDSKDYFPEWTWNTNNEFIRAYYWSAIRNHAINFSIIMETGKTLKVLYHFGNARNFYEVRKKKVGNLPYMQFYVKDRRFQCGWLNGDGRFEVELFIKKK